MDHVLTAISLAIEAITALIVAQYDADHQSRCLKDSTTSFAWKHDSSFWENSTITKDILLSAVVAAIRDPSPFLFITAISLSALSIVLLSHLRRRDRYQNHFLAVGIFAPVIFASIRYVLFANAPRLKEMRGIVPWSLLAASVASIVVHEKMGWQTGDEQEDEVAESFDVEKRQRKAGKGWLRKSIWWRFDGRFNIEGAMIL